MGAFLNSPTDPLEVLCDNAVKAIRRHMAVVHARIAEWEPRPYDQAPAYGYQRPARPQGVGR